MSKDLWEAYWRDEAQHPWWEVPALEVLGFISSESPNKRPDVLDLGCGVGRHAIAFAQAGFSVTATDASATAITHLRQWAARLNLPVRTMICDILDTGLPPDSFDIVLSYDVIYHGHREQFAEAFDHVRRLLRPGGLFFFTCPSREDGKYGHGEEVSPHTFLSMRSVIPGDIHYFAGGADLDEMLAGFRQLWRRKQEHYWDNEGFQQFHSYWQVLAERSH